MSTTKPQLSIEVAMLSRDTTKNETAVTLMKLSYAFGKLGYNLLPFVIDTCFVDEGRNLSFKVAQDNRVDYLLFVDSDINVKGNVEQAIKGMIDLDKDVVTGIYYGRNFPHRPSVYKLIENGKIWALDDIPSQSFKVEISGCGLMLIRKNVLDAFTDHVISTEGKPFDFIAKEGGPFREDVSFCIRLKKLGFEIWAEPAIEIDHLAKTPITAADWKKSKKEEFEKRGRTD